MTRDTELRHDTTFTTEIPSQGYSTPSLMVSFDRIQYIIKIYPGGLNGSHGGKQKVGGGGVLGSFHFFFLYFFSGLGIIAGRGLLVGFRSLCDLNI